MAGASLLALIDDIAALLDDIAVMSKVAAKKTAGVLGDDLALNAQQVAGVAAERELPVVWAVAKGSMKNKVILVPVALLISAVMPALITPLLMIGGAFLCYEGVEKLAHSLFQTHSNHSAETVAKRVSALPENLVDYEKDKIKGAIRTDFILSAEIIVIALGSVAEQPFLKQCGVLAAISIVMTLGVYGLVAAIVKLDDLGFYLQKKQQPAVRLIGASLVSFAPYLMKALSVLGTAAMFLVGGSILAHGLPDAHHWIHAIQEYVRTLCSIEWLIALILPALLEAMIGIVVGGVVLAATKLIAFIRGK